MLSEAREPVVALLDDRDDATVARPHFLDVGERLLVDGGAGRHDHDRHRVVDQGDRSVLHLACGVALGVDVADLFELERPLERDRELGAAAEVEERMGSRVFVGDRLVDVELVEDSLHRRGHSAQLFDQSTSFVGIDRAAAAAEPDREQRDTGELRRERLRRRDADLGARVCVQHAVRFTRDRRLDHVADRERLRPQLTRLPHRGERVGGLAGLADRHA